MLSQRALRGHLRRVWQLAPEAAAIHASGARYDWRQLAGAARAMEERCASLSLPPGSGVGVVAHNRAATVAALAAVAGAGHCLVTFNPMHPAGKIAEELAAMRLPLLIAAPDEAGAGPLREAAARCGCAVLAARDSPGGIELDFLGGGRAGQSCPPREGVAILMQSSGTTGAPKRIPLEYSGLLHAISRQLPQAGGGEMRAKATPAIVASPLAHIGGLFFSLKAIVDARPQILMERFDAELWSAMVQRHRLKLGHLVPATVKMLLDSRVPAAELASLKAIVCGAAALRPDIQSAFEERYGLPLLVVYGATEFAGGVAGWTLPLHREFMPAKLGSVGRAFPGSELRVVDEASGAPLPSGEQGILEVRSVQAGAEGAAWVRTTDVAALDEDGFLWIRGRADAAINRGGFKVLPSEVEEVLRGHPAVEEAVVVALDDERLGQVPAALVAPAGGARIDVGSLESHARRGLSAYQVPARFLVAGEIPRNSALKPDLPAIRSLFEGRR